MYDEKEVPIITVMNQVMHMEMKSASQLFKQYDLKPWQAGILFALHHNSVLSQRELAKKMRLTPPTITARNPEDGETWIDCTSVGCTGSENYEIISD